MANPTFAETYCAKHGLAPALFAPTVLRRTLYPHARLLRPIIQLFNANHFAADLDLVRAAGGLRHVSDLAEEFTNYTHHPANHGFWRTQLFVRISIFRLHVVMRAALPRGPEREPRPSRYKDFPTPLAENAERSPARDRGKF